MELYKLKIPPVPYLLMTTSMVVLYTRSSHWKAGPMNQSASSTVCGRPCGITRTEEWHYLMNGASPEWEQLLSFSSISLSACHLCSEWPFVAWETLAGAQGFGLARWWCGTMAKCLHWGIFAWDRAGLVPTCPSGHTIPPHRNQDQLLSQNLTFWDVINHLKTNTKPLEAQERPANHKDQVR